MRMPSIDRRFSKASLRATGLLLVFAALLAGCGSSRKLSSLEVPLAFRPEVVTPGKYGPLPPSPGLRLAIPPVADEREIKDNIGMNLEIAGKDPRPITAANGTPAEFLHNVLAGEFKSAGYAPIPDGSGANRVLTVHLRKFFTTETNEYFGEITIAAEVRDQSGSIVWQGQTSGTSRRFGRSMSTENYQESFSDAALIAIENLINNKQFQAAMTVK